MSGTEPKESVSALKIDEKQADGADELVNPDSNIDDPQLEGNEGGEFDEGKNLGEEKNQEGDQEHGEGHGDGEEAGLYNRKK